MPDRFESARVYSKRDRATGRSQNPFPPSPTPYVSSNNEQIPLYAADGTSLGFRSLEAAKRLIEGGHVKPAYGRKGHLKAIWLRQEDGGSPVETQPRSGTRYSFLQNLDSGLHCWKLRRVDGRDGDGLPVITRNVFLQVVADCLVA
jgi:hypothetical protein